MTKWIKVAVAGVAALALVILVYALLTPDQSTGATDHMGMWDGHMTYSTRNFSLIALSIVVIAVSIMVVILWQGYEPLPPSMAPQTPVAPQRAPELPSWPTTPTPLEGTKPDELAAHNYLVLRLLTGDERTMYKALMDSSGEALQKDLMARTRMSNAKVSRVLDRLSEKGIVTKERYGATNRVRIKLDR